MKVESPSLAEDWRYKVRTILTTLFEQNYAIVRMKRIRNMFIAIY